MILFNMVTILFQALHCARGCLWSSCGSIVPAISIYVFMAWQVYFGEFGVNVNRNVGCHCIIVIKNGLPVLCNVNA